MEIADVSVSEYYDLDEIFRENESQGPRNHEKSIEKQINRIFKGTIVCSDNQDKGTHRLSGAVEAERKTDEQHEKKEYKGEASLKYEYDSKDRQTKFKTEGAVDSKGDFKGRVELSREW